MATHLQLWQVCRDQEAYKAGTDTDDHNKPDCSCGCIHFHALAGKEGSDWGVCTEPQSPRAGLLTFEHMGCPYWSDECPVCHQSMSVENEFGDHLCKPKVEDNGSL